MFGDPPLDVGPILPTHMVRELNFRRAPSQTFTNRRAAAPCPVPPINGARVRRCPKDSALHSDASVCCHVRGQWRGMTFPEGERCCCLHGALVARQTDNLRCNRYVAPLGALPRHGRCQTTDALRRPHAPPLAGPPCNPRGGARRAAPRTPTRKNGGCVPIFKTSVAQVLDTLHPDGGRLPAEGVGHDLGTTWSQLACPRNPRKARGDEPSPQHRAKVGPRRCLHVGLQRGASGGKGGGRKRPWRRLPGPRKQPSRTKSSKPSVPQATAASAWARCPIVRAVGSPRSRRASICAPAPIVPGSDREAESRRPKRHLNRRVRRPCPS